MEDGETHSPNGEANDEAFVRQAMEAQRNLHAYILMLAPSIDAADDILQETNLVIWRKRSTYQPDIPFIAWAKRIAYFQVLAHRKRQQRDRLHFDDELLDRIAAESEADAPYELDRRRRALSECVGKLSERDRELLQHRYTLGLTAPQIAEAVGRTVDALYQAFRRIRLALIDCVARALDRDS